MDNDRADLHYSEITCTQLASFPGSIPHKKEPGNETNTQPRSAQEHTWLAPITCTQFPGSIPHKKEPGNEANTQPRACMLYAYPQFIYGTNTCTTKFAKMGENARGPVMVQNFT